MKILIVKTSSMGDVIHTLPVVADIKAHLPNAQIDWLVEKPFDQITQLCPMVTNTLPLRWRKWRKSLLTSDTRQAMRSLKAQLQAAQYDLVLDLQGLIKSALWAKLAKGKALHGYDWQSAREPLASLGYTKTHSVDKNLLAIHRSRLLASAALGYTPQGAPQFVMDIAGVENTFAVPAPYVCIIHGASTIKKVWPIKDTIRLAQFLANQGLGIVLFWGSDEEKARSELIAKALAVNGIDAYIPPFLTISQCAALLAQSRAVIGADTGFTHLAGALGNNTLSLHQTHDPVRTGVQGNGLCLSLGGVNQIPSYAAVEAAAQRLINE